jgi:putative component of membrane protein insertase Oxa1/YidC/SpoIIIJ protein YidD
MKRLTTILITLLVVSAAMAMAQDDLMKGPWQGSKAREIHRESATNPATASAALVKFFSQYLSPVDGSDCPMYPSCSRYSMACFEAHGFLMGWMMTWDRLYRCGRDELRLSPQMIVDGQYKCYDPVESNDFWWSHGK